MKHFLFAAALLTGAGVPLMADEKPASAAPNPATPAPAAPTPGAPAASAPVPGAPAAPAPASSSFQDPAERRSYALGVFFANQLKRADDGTRKVNLDDVEAGLKAILAAEKSVDFAQGATMGSMIKRDDIAVNVKMLLDAFRAVSAGTKSKMTDAEMRSEMMLVQQEATQRRQEKTKIEAENNLKEAEAFLAKNKSADGVKTTASGLQYQVVQAGKTEKKPGPDDMVTVNYVASTLSNREFDRTPEGAPRTMPQSLNKGWGEAMQLMTVGSKYRFWIPPALGWGEQGRGSQVRPNTLLIYDVELVDTAPAPPKPATTATTPPISVPGSPPPPGNRKPITATTPPVSVEIPAKGGKPEVKVVDPSKAAPKLDPKPAAPAPKKD